MDTERSKREKNFSALPKVKLESWQLSNTRVFTDRIDMLTALAPRNARLAEIGVSRGDLTTELISILQPEKIYLVDNWQGSRYGPHKEILQKKITQSLSKGLAEIRQGMSVERIAEFEDQSLDAAYLDTNHTYNLTSEELGLLGPKIKPGGLIFGDDYMVGNVVSPLIYGVINAFHQFAVENSWTVAGVSLDPTGSFNIAIRKPK